MEIDMDIYDDKTGAKLSKIIIAIGGFIAVLFFAASYFFSMWCLA
jgi:hypothetical protein